MIFSVCGQKGGTGKSTIAVHLCWWLKHEAGLNVALMDCDVQESSSRWLGDMKAEYPVARVLDVNRIRADLKQLDQTYEVVVVDGPAGLAELSMRILLASDMVLVPCGPSQLDVEASMLAVNAIKEAQDTRGSGKPNALFICNKLQVQTLLSKELLEVAQNVGIPMAHTPIKHRQVYAAARETAETVFEMGYKGKVAAEDLRNLFSEVLNYGDERRSPA